jgi:hypothetical protein
MSEAERQKRSRTAKRNFKAKQKLAAQANGEGGNGGNGGTRTITLEGATPAITAILGNPIGPWNGQQLDKAWRDVQELSTNSQKSLAGLQAQMVSIQSAYGFIESCRNRHQVQQQTARLTRAAAGGQA